MIPEDDAAFTVRFMTRGIPFLRNPSKTAIATKYMYKETIPLLSHPHFCKHSIVLW